MSLQVTGITKSYGTEQALKGVSFEVRKGEIVGFLGPNGAGKSTLMKILTTYVHPDGGEATLNGFDIKTQVQDVRKSVGYLPEHNPLYTDLYVREFLEFSADVFRVPKSRIQEVIDLTGLQDESHKKISQLSKGYRQRVGLANALLHDPEVLILDEPTTGLDPNQLVEIRNLIKEVGKNKTVFLSTHIMQEVESMCDRVIIINKGSIVADQKLRELTENGGTQIIFVEFDYKIEEEAVSQMPHLKSYRTYNGFEWELTFEATKDMRPTVFDFAHDNGLKTLQLAQQNKNLEKIFRELTSNTNS